MSFYSVLTFQTACVAQLESIGRLLQERAKQPAYQYLRSQFKLHGWVLEESLFTFPAAVLCVDDTKVRSFVSFVV